MVEFKTLHSRSAYHHDSPRSHLDAVAFPGILIKTYGTSTLSSANNNVASGESGSLPQNLGDRFGWNTMVSILAQGMAPCLQMKKLKLACLRRITAKPVRLIFSARSSGLPVVISCTTVTSSGGGFARTGPDYHWSSTFIGQFDLQECDPSDHYYLSVLAWIWKITCPVISV